MGLINLWIIFAAVCILLACVGYISGLTTLRESRVLITFSIFLPVLLPLLLLFVVIVFLVAFGCIVLGIELPK